MKKTVIFKNIEVAQQPLLGKSARQSDLAFTRFNLQFARFFTITNQRVPRVPRSLAGARS